MDYYINQNLLYAFIYRYYPFQNITENLIRYGQIMVQMIIKTLIEKEESLENLKGQFIKSLSNLAIVPFTYRIGGDNMFYGAFGNFLIAIFNSDPNPSQSNTHAYLTEKSSHELKNHPLFVQQMKYIEHPFIGRLKKIAYIHKFTNKLPLIDQKQSQTKKVHFLNSFINPQQIEPQQKKRKYQKKNKNLNSKSMKSTQSYFETNSNEPIFDCDKIEEQKNTEIDEFQEPHSQTQHNFLIQKTSLQKESKSSHRKSKSNKILKKPQIAIKQKDNLVLNFDDLLGISNKIIRSKSKKETKLSRI